MSNLVTAGENKRVLLGSLAEYRFVCLACQNGLSGFATLRYRSVKH
jgi:hypothetical protein